MSDEQKNVAEIEADNRAAITDWVEGHVGGRVTHIERLHRWRPMWIVDVANSNSPKLVIRSLRPWEAIPYSLEHEAKLLQVLEAHGIPTPHVHGMMSDPPAIIIDFAKGGRDPGLVQHASESASTMSPKRWQASLRYMDLLAKMHAIPVAAFAHTEGGDPQGEKQIAVAHYDRNLALLEERGGVDAMVAFFTRWLHRKHPRRSERCFVTGDCGQFLSEDGEVTAVLDVEIGHIGDPMHDLACFRGRHPVENMGDVPELFHRYARARGAPVDIDAIAYHTVSFLALATIGPLIALIEKHPGGDILEAFMQLAFIGRRALEAMAEIEGVELDDIRLPAARLSPYQEAAAAKLDSEIATLPTSPEFPEWQRHVLLSLPNFWRNMARYGDWMEEADMAGAAAFLGAQPADPADADRRLKVFVESAGPDQDAALIRYFHGKMLRLCRVLGGADAPEDNILFIKMEPILHRRAEFQTLQPEAAIP